MTAASDGRFFVSFVNGQLSVVRCLCLSVVVDDSKWIKY